MDDDPAEDPAIDPERDEFTLPEISLRLGDDDVGEEYGCVSLLVFTPL